jgi:hypothetical protein
MRLLLPIVILLSGFCLYAEDFRVDPFEIVIRHPEAASPGALLDKKMHTLLSFPRHEDRSVTDLVNRARRESLFLRIFDLSHMDEYGQQKIIRTMEVLSSPLPSSNFITYSSDKIKCYDSLTLFGEKFNSTFMSYKRGNKDVEIELFYPHIQDYFYATLEKAKSLGAEVEIDITALRNRKKQQLLKGSDFLRIVNK